jgi:hypothetical protein
MAFVTLGLAACSRSGTKDENEQQAEARIDPALARAVGRVVQPCIRAHQSSTPSFYAAQLRMERGPTGTAVPSFMPGRTSGHEPFEACALQAIRQAGIQLKLSTTLPVAFDFGPEK